MSDALDQASPREIAIKTYWYRKGLAAGLAMSNTASRSGECAERVCQAEKLYGRRLFPVLVKLLREGVGLLDRRMRRARQSATTGDDMRQHQVFERFDPVLQRNVHSGAPSSAQQDDPAANEEKRISALVFAHRLSGAAK